MDAVRHPMLLTGLFAALATPVDESGAIDGSTLDRLCEFVLERGVDGIVLGGATSEYPRFEAGERLEVLERVARYVAGRTTILTAIGAASLTRVLELGRAAADHGSRALLVPMPMFFRYQQEDLAAYCAHVAAGVPRPCVLYDLSESPNPLAAETAIALLEQHPQIVGIKDSSGRAENLRRYAAARGVRDWSLLVGDDRYLLEGLQAGWNGGISGIACCCPELVVTLHRSAREGDFDEARRCQALLDELIAQLARLPTPWGIRLVLRVRGIDVGPFPLPLAPQRRAQIAQLERWTRDWLARADIPNLLPA